MLYLPNVFGQASNNGINPPINNISKLKEGTLVVRLDMKYSKVAAYQDMLLQESLSEKERIKTIEKLEKLKTERSIYKLNVMNAFEKAYTFSSVAFIENTYFNDYVDSGDLSKIETKYGSKNGIEKGRDVYYLIQGEHETHWIVCDAHLKKVKSPFPSEHDLGLKKFLDFIVGKENYSMENMIKVVAKMNDRFYRFYINTNPAIE